VVEQNSNQVAVGLGSYRVLVDRLLMEREPEPERIIWANPKASQN
jgi:hypothetical protein